MSRKPESLLRSKTLRELKLIPNTWWEAIENSAKRGTPDVIGCAHGRLYGIEFKCEWTTKYDPRERLQRYKLARIFQAGGIAMFIFNDTWRFHVQRIRERHELWQRKMTEAGVELCPRRIRQCSSPLLCKD